VIAFLNAEIIEFAEKRWRALGRGGFGHADDGEGFSVAEWDGDGLDDLIAAEFVERDAGEGGAHFEAREAGGFGGVFAGCEEQSAEAAAGPIRVDEDGADFGGVQSGIEKIGFANGGVVAAEEGFAFAPTAAGDDYFCGRAFRCFRYEIGLVCDELGVEAEDGAESAFDLGGRIVVGLEDADGGFNEGVESREVCGAGEADVKRACFGRVHPVNVTSKMPASEGRRYNCRCELLVLRNAYIEEGRFGKRPLQRRQENSYSSDEAT
jgi:hypothetical protein